MTRTYALKRLLEHGVMTYRELLQVTGWPPRVLSKTLHHCVSKEQLRRVSLRFRSTRYGYVAQAVWP